TKLLNRNHLALIRPYYTWINGNKLADFFYSILFGFSASRIRRGL
ncbi:hypothetical protein LSH36_110g04006, partial [Paralvinella palmiformis]